MPCREDVEVLGPDHPGVAGAESREPPPLPSYVLVGTRKVVRSLPRASTGAVLTSSPRTSHNGCSGSRRKSPTVVGAGDPDSHTLWSRGVRVGDRDTPGVDGKVGAERVAEGRFGPGVRRGGIPRQHCGQPPFDSGPGGPVGWWTTGVGVRRRSVGSSRAPVRALDPVVWPHGGGARVWRRGAGWDGEWEGE